MTRVYVVVESGKSEILGYHAINVGMMNVALMPKPPKGTPSHGQVPVLFLGQVAVTISAQGMGIGSVIMHHVFKKAATIATQAGCHAILLDVMSDGDAAAFRRRSAWYRGFGFQNFPSNEARMFMTIQQVRLLTDSREGVEA